MNKSEYQEQVQVFKYLDLQYPNVLACSQVAGANLSRTASIKAKNQGYKAGFPDITIMKPILEYHGLYIEMKIETSYKISTRTGKKVQYKKGVLSEEQREWILKLNQLDYFACVCRGFDEAKYIIDLYLNDDNNKYNVINDLNRFDISAL